jgi:hypothetical protein
MERMRCDAFDYFLPIKKSNILMQENISDGIKNDLHLNTNE